MSEKTPDAPPPSSGADEDPSQEAASDTAETVLGDLPKAVRQKVEAFIPELVKKAFTAGMGAMLTTPEGIRRLTKDLKVPKDVAGYLANTASSTKDEFVRIVASEVREFLDTINFGEEIAKMLTTLSFEVKTEIRFIPNDEKLGGVEPDVKARVGLKRSGKRRERTTQRIRRALTRKSDDNDDDSDAKSDDG